MVLMPLVVTARGSWDLQRPFYLPRTLCHIVCRSYLSSMRKQGVALLAALQTVFTDQPLYPAFD
jgi:hypothetical protein